MNSPDFSKASEAELITIICHDPMATPDDIYLAKQKLMEVRKPKRTYPRMNQNIKPVYQR
ncbi:MAG: hypothetical protein ACQEXQ_16070 [Bacillota bacterium]